MTEKEIFAQGYPGNLILAAKGKTELPLPALLSPDICAGVEYALSTLEDREEAVLRHRFMEIISRAEIAAFYGVSREQVRQLESRALQKLRLPFRWNYVRYGVDGYTQRIIADAYKKGFDLGYEAGYQHGVQKKETGTNM